MNKITFNLLLTRHRFQWRTFFVPLSPFWFECGNQIVCFIRQKIAQQILDFVDISWNRYTIQNKQKNCTRYLQIFFPVDTSFRPFSVFKHTRKILSIILETKFLNQTHESLSIVFNGIYTMKDIYTFSWELFSFSQRHQLSWSLGISIQDKWNVVNENSFTNRWLFAILLNKK